MRIEKEDGVRELMRAAGEKVDGFFWERGEERNQKRENKDRK